ncbi:MAG: ECF transporter S component [Clostridia bacterium]|nr:ECF transporter S component [Clostridia bacterium]
MTKTIKAISTPTIKTKVLATILATASAVVLPQLFHVVGEISGLGTALGETFLPMHLPVLMLGLLMGKYCGAVAGFAAPVISFVLTGMPKVGLLPFMAIELCAYGFVMGALKDKKLPTSGKVLLSQFAGRLLRAVAIALAVYAFDYTSLNISIIWTSVVSGLPGLILQWILIPLISFYVETKAKNEC